MLNKIHILLLLAFCFAIAACNQSESVTTATATPTPVPTAPTPTSELEAPDKISAQVSEYSLGEGIIVQDQFPADNRFRNMPVRLEGVIGIPEADGPSPVVLILHGSHPFCSNDEVWPCPPEDERPNYAGFTYLVEALAEAGYVALSINVNAEYTFAFGESPAPVRTTQLIDLHLQELLAANAGESDKFGLSLTGQIDPSRMVWIGHSRGADFVNWIVREQGLDLKASAVGYGPVQGLLLVAPPAMFLEALPTVDLPAALIMPACDGDVVGLEGQRFYESARFDMGRVSPFTSVYLEHGNHNNFNAILAPDRILENRPDCAEDVLLEPLAQQGFLEQYAVDFVNGLYRNAADTHSQLGLDMNQPLPEKLYGFAVQVLVLPTVANRLSVIIPQDQAELSRNRMDGEITVEGVAVTFCQEGYFVPADEPGTEPCKRVNFNQPGFPQQLVFAWDESGAEWRTAVPPAYADLSGYATLQLRVAQDPLSELNRAGEAQSFSLELVDGDGVRLQIEAPPVGFPVGLPLQNEYFEGGSFSGHVHMNMLRFPLAEMTGIDLEHIVELALIFNQTPSGSLFVADLEYIGNGE